MIAMSKLNNISVIGCTIKVTGPWKHYGEGPLEVMAFHETNRVKNSSIRPPVIELCRVESCMKMSFKDTLSLLVREKKTKRRSNIACRWLWQVCMANVDMGTLPRLARWRVLHIWPTNSRVALKEIEKKPSLQNRCSTRSLGHQNIVERDPRHNVIAGG